MTQNTQMVRNFSAIGPCIPLGKFIKRTAKTVTFKCRYGGTIRRVGGYRLKVGLIHTEPCVSCQDHERTQYPNGYMD